jgi:hypothetical protein
VYYRFRVKVEVSAGDSTCVFVLFDSDMSYIMEKSCAHFVGKFKVCILFWSCSVLAFIPFIGYLILFIVGAK